MLFSVFNYQLGVPKTKFKAMYKLKNWKLLVTGASHGIGAATAKAFAEEGCDLAITYLGLKDKADAVAAGIWSSTGRQVEILQATSTVFDDCRENKCESILADTAKELSLIPECKRVVEEAVKSLGGLDIVVHKALNLSTSLE